MLDGCLLGCLENKDNGWWLINPWFACERPLTLTTFDQISVTCYDHKQVSEIIHWIERGNIIRES